MKKTEVTYLYEKIIFCFCLIVLGACATSSKKPVTAPGLSVIEFEKLRQQGDVEFTKMYWAGWKKALACYEKALASREDKELRQKMCYALLLLQIREYEMGFRTPTWAEKFHACLQLLPTKENRAYAAWCEAFLNISPLRYHALLAILDRKIPAVPLPRDPANEFKSYSEIFFLANCRPFDEVRQLNDNFLNKWADSRLTLFLKGTQDNATIDQCLAEFPDFVEMLFRRAANYAVEKKYRQAFVDYRAGLEIMPGYYEAHIAMANIFFHLGLTEEALANYEQALNSEPLAAVALFGKAVCLSDLGRTAESDAVLHFMLENQKLFHGEANYYLASHAYLGGKKTEANTFLDQARSYIPDAVEVNLLYGLLHLDKNMLDEASQDFRRVLEKSPEVGDAHLALGGILLRQKQPPQAASHFQQAARCFEREVIAQEKRGEELAAAEMEEAMRLRLLAKAEKYLNHLLDECTAKMTEVLKQWQPAAEEKSFLAILARLQKKRALAASTPSSR